MNKRPKKIAKEKELEACAEKKPYFPPQFSLTSLKESIIDSIKKSSYCFFGLSSYINLAISLKANVIAVTTSKADKGL